ncbi:hypothetical protein FB550_12024 [Neobacillus bataviensis]|uniref:DUF1643 domain-containing protein n=1 Tax=Neobacillus bataviensis TaxID=220685 RepID=A0A561CMM1_9BACI|nr:DUF1643 domain-containing protein [Neobacillus bataviensis]TWD92212.1 hypothetical protein FB550_12024 [Neobacillus bataviensis]
MQEKSKTGILRNLDFRDSLIIDKYNSDLQTWRRNKLDHLKSENSEDAMTWNVFRSLNQINPNIWLPRLLRNSFLQDFGYSSESVEISLWKKIQPLARHVKEGPTEIDIIIETNQFVWLIEAKYKSDISKNTTHDTSRNQVIRNIDVGLDYAKEKDLYFSMLILDEKHSPTGYSITNKYSQSIVHVEKELPYRVDGCKNLKGISVITWKDILNVLDETNELAENQFERFIAKQVEQWLRKKIEKPAILKNSAIFDETKTYRYSLTRVWDSSKEKVVFICLNPSTADAEYNDPTLKRCIDFAERWHNRKYGSLEMVNLFSYRATDFDNLKGVDDPIGTKTNSYILNAVESASLVVVAWGENGSFRNRNKEVLKMISSVKTSIHCLEVLKCKQPKHPLYAKKDLNPIIFLQ